MTGRIQTSAYGTHPEYGPVTLYTLTNDQGMVASCTDFGAILCGLLVPDRDGVLGDVTLGCDTLEQWIADQQHLGANAGRCANRIADGRFELDGQTYQLAKNNPPNHLHGGVEGFNKKLWTGEAFEEHDAIGVRFQYVSPAGEEGYPGTLWATVTYRLTDANELKVRFKATCDAATVVNLVHHSYWNLAADPTQTVRDHELTVHAETLLKKTDTNVPTGQRLQVADTAGGVFDFRQPRRIGDAIDSPVMASDKGYDHCFVVDGEPFAMRPVAVLKDPGSGRVMTLSADQPGVHVYTGNFLSSDLIGKGNVPLCQHGGVCLETEHFPDAINHADFPSPVIRPGLVYRHEMVHAFSAE